MTKRSPKLEEVFDRLSMMRQGRFDVSGRHANPAGCGSEAMHFFDGAARVGTRFAENGG